VVAATLGITGAAVGPVIIAPLMTCLGLTSIGPAAGGIFAGCQALGVVTAGSVCACCQSAAMGGEVGAIGGILSSLSGAAGAFLG